MASVKTFEITKFQESSREMSKRRGRETSIMGCVEKSTKNVQESMRTLGYF